MLTAEVKINGALIYHIYVHNEERYIKTHPDAKCSYYFEIYQPQKEISKGKITHARTDGALVLLNKILSKEVKHAKLVRKPHNHNRSKRGATKA